MGSTDGIKSRLIRVQERMKRGIDLAISILGLIVTSPIMLAIAITIRLTSPGPAVFKQERAGIGGNVFTTYKFRTMATGAEDFTVGRYISETEESITEIGRFLRRWGLDELLQLINVLKGDMSIVGPRPTLKYQVEKYNNLQRKRLLVKPGITGWAQVNGRNSLTWPKRIELDVWYVENWSLLLDIRIILMTIPALLRKDFAFTEENVEDDEIVRFKE